MKMLSRLMIVLLSIPFAAEAAQATQHHHRAAHYHKKIYAASCSCGRPAAGASYAMAWDHGYYVGNSPFKQWLRPDGSLSGPIPLSANGG